MAASTSPTTKPPGSELLEGVDSSDKKEEDKPQVGFFEVFKYADRTDRALMIVGGLGAFTAGAGLPAFSEIFGRVVNTLLFEGADSVEDAMSTLALYFVYVGLGMLVLSSLQVGCYMISAHRQVSRIKLLYFKSLLRQDIAWTDENKPGELTSRMDGDTTVLRNSINDKLSVGISAFGTFIFGFALGFYRSWELTLLMVGALPLIAVVSAIMGSIMEKMSKDTREGYANAGAIALEVFDNIKTVQTFGEEEHEVQRFRAAAEPAVGFGIKKDFAAATAAGSVTCIMFIVYAIAFWFSSYLIEWKRNDVGEILAAFFSTLMASFSLGMVFPSVNAFMEGRAAAYRIFETIARKPPIDIYSDGEDDDEDASSTSSSDNSKNMSTLPSSKPPPTFERSIELRDVTFAYPTRKDFKLFEGLNLTITKGQNVAFSGASGCGKSSIIQLLQRFYDVDGGEVLVDGVNLKEFSVRKWRDQIGIVSQEPNLFSGSITANVRVGKEDATQEEIEAACKSAQIHDLIMTLPDKYDTSVGQGGTSLSGGQKQRIAIARAIIRKPTILILDEATSALDRTSEIEVQAALENITSEGGGVVGSSSGADDMFKSRMTVVSIAHRLSTIRNCDVIYFIAHDDVKGSWVEESGSYNELIVKDGQFAAMTRRQQIGNSAQEADDDDDDTTITPSTANPVSPMLVTTPGSATIQAPNDSSFSANPTALPLDTDPDTGALKQVTDEEIEEAVPAPYGRVLTLLKPDCWAVIVGLAGSITQGVVYPAYSIIFTQMLNVLGRYADDGPGLRREVPLWAGLFIATGFTSLFSWLMIGCYSIAGERLTLNIRERLFRAMLRQDMLFFDTPGRDTGSLAGMLAADTELVHALWGPSIGTKVQMFANVSGGVIIAFVYQWKVALVVLSGIPLLAITSALQQALMMGTGSFTSKEGNSDDTIKAESLTNIRTVTSFNMQKRCLDQYEDSVQQGHYRGVRDGIVLGAIYGLTQFSLYAIMALAFWFGGTLIAKGEADFLDVTVAAMSILMAGMGMGEVGGFAAKFKDAGIASKRVFYVLDKTPKIDPLGMGVVPACNAEGARVNAELEAVRFRYPSRPGAKVLSSVSMTIEDGKSYGLMGLTGCGKSTIIQLLARFYDPLRGRILVGDAKEDMCEIGLVEWRKNIAIVLQEPALFSGTVMENIKYGGFVATEEEVYEVARLAQIHDDVVAMPNGYDTQVGYKGRALSGGQKQRVAIARALLRKPRLLLLDEATSALDNATESKVQQGILDAQAKHKMTIVAIAHRLTTIKDCDTIMVMHDGMVIESGSHEDLIHKGGEYKKRWEAYEHQKSA